MRYDIEAGRFTKEKNEFVQSGPLTKVMGLLLEVTT